MKKDWKRIAAAERRLRLAREHCDAISIVLLQNVSRSPTEIKEALDEHKAAVDALIALGVLP